MYIQSGGLVTIFNHKKGKFDYFRSMQFIVFITVATVSIFLVFLFSKLLNDTYNEKAIDQKVESVESQCGWLANQVVGVNFLIDDSSNSISTQTNELAASLNGRIIIIKSNYKIIKDTTTDFQDKFFISESLSQVMNGEKKHMVTTRGENMEIMIPIKSSNKKDSRILGAVIATVSLKDMNQVARNLTVRRNMLLVAFMICSISFALVLSYMMTKDFGKIKKDLDFIAAGHEDEQIRNVAFTEVNDLVTLFNEILAKSQILESSRQEFVSNVSHELKTPMTSMKVLADSLLQQGDQVPAELYREFMGDMVKEIDRENIIISDLLSLVKLDKKAAKLEITNININELLEVILKRLKPIAEQRNIELILESFRPVSADIDEVKLTLALSNLIENGIKYNQDNGWVRVSLNADHKFLYIKVADSGVGIPEDCQDQVFERFYRVDKARSRDTGGTGLGLAITKNCVLLHNGEIKIYSKLGEGTTFTVRIPLKYQVQGGSNDK
jgi:signal transduction histidine kinase